MKTLTTQTRFPSLKFIVIYKMFTSPRGSGNKLILIRNASLVFVLVFSFRIASRGAGAQSVPVSRLVVGSIPTRGDEIFYIFMF